MTEFSYMLPENSYSSYDKGHQISEETTKE